MVYFYNLLDLFGRRHCLSTIIWMFCTIAAFCVDDLVVIVSFLLPDFLDFFSAFCNTFTARTDLSPLSPTRMYDMSLFTLIARIGFSYISRILGCILAHFSDNKNCIFACCWHCSSVPSLAVFLHGLLDPVPGCFFSRVLGSRPWLFFFTGTWVPSLGCSSSQTLGSRPWLFVFLLVHLIRVLLRTSWLTALQTYSWHFPFEPILGFHSRASPAPSRHFRAASCATSRLVWSSSSILW